MPALLAQVEPGSAAAWAAAGWLLAPGAAAVIGCLAALARSEDAGPLRREATAAVGVAAGAAALALVGLGCGASLGEVAGAWTIFATVGAAGWGAVRLGEGLAGTARTLGPAAGATLFLVVLGAFMAQPWASNGLVKQAGADNRDLAVQGLIDRNPSMAVAGLLAGDPGVDWARRPYLYDRMAWIDYPWHYPAPRTPAFHWGLLALASLAMGRALLWLRARFARRPA